MKLFIAMMLLMLYAPAWAINKCSDSNGQFSYQEAPCNLGTKPLATPYACCSSTEVKTSWKFERSMDKMTGVSTCLATSAPVIIPAGPRATAEVYMQIALRRDFASLNIRTDKQSDIFHPQLEGMGIKAGSFDFLPITQKVSANSVGFKSTVDAAMVILKMLPASKDVKVRLRFWPWEQLNDSFEPISLQGFKQAYALAEDCSKKN